MAHDIEIECGHEEASSHFCPICDTSAPVVDVEKALYDALVAVLVMWKAERPVKLDDALAWRANDDKAQEMGEQAIALYDSKGKL